MDSIAQERLVRSRPGRSVLPDDSIWLKDIEAGMPVREVAQKYGVSRDAVYKRLRDLRNSPGRANLLPWVVAGVHREGATRILLSLYAYAKHSRGEAVSKEELHMANKLREIAAKLGTIIYNPIDGFQWRERRPDDTDIMMPE